MTDFQVACRLDEVALDSAIHVDLDGVPMAIARSADGVFAIRDVCSHADVRLSEGEVTGCLIECWLHGSQFDLRTGQPISLPAITPVSVYPVRVTGDGADAVIEVSTTPLETITGAAS